MLSLDDPRWAGLAGGYRTRLDVRPLLKRLESEEAGPVWTELWSELYHQGRVGDASYAAVPHLVRIYRDRGLCDWNAFGLVAAIDAARDDGKNPTLPEWLEASYNVAIEDLARAALAELPQHGDVDTVRALLAVIALWKGARAHGRFLIEFGADEVLDLEQLANEKR